MAGYTRQSAADIVNGEVIKAPPLNTEFNQVESAFNASTGHKHDGTAGEGGPIPLISDTNGYTAVQVDEANAEVEFYVNVSSAAVQQIGLIDGVLQPTTTNDVDLGTSSLKFKDIHIAGTANLPTVDINAGAIDGTIIGANSAAAGTFTDLTATGTTTLATVDINGGAIDGTTIGASSPSTGVYTTLSTTGELTAASATVSDLTSGRIVLAGTSGSLTDSATLTYTAGTPSASTDVATKGYVDNVTVVDALPITGGDAGKYVVVNGTETGVTSKVLDISDDTTPQLGGNLDGQGNTISNVLLKDAHETEHALGTVSTTATIDITNGNVFSATLGAATTFTFSNPTATGDATSFTLIMTNFGAFTPTWPASVKWPGGTQPTWTAAGVDIAVFTTIDGGTTWYGMQAGAGFA